MDFNWYNKMLQGRCIYRSQQNIEVFENSQYRWIQFNARFIQSMISKKKPHLPVLPYLPHFLLFTRIFPGNICLLGLGGGCALHVLSLHLNHALVAVERYEDMIHIAKTFFNIPEHPNIHIVHDSAEHFIANTQNQYRHLLIDLGDKEGFPESCRNQTFIDHCYHALQDKGILMLNLSHYPDLNFFKPLLKLQFSQSPLVIEADGNWILSVGKKISRDDILQKLQQMGYLKSHHWHPGHGELLTLHPAWLIKIKQFFLKFLDAN